MSYRPWLLGSAFACLIALGVSSQEVSPPIVDTIPPSEGTGAGGEASPADSNERAENKSSSSDRFLRTRPLTRTPPSSPPANRIADEDYCETPEELRTARCLDLAAQIEMSMWALASLILTGMGVVLVGLTLKATRDAAYYAKLAADAGKEAVRQAELTNISAIRTSETAREANEIMRQEQRPWLYFEIVPDGNLEWVRGRRGVSIFARITCTNYGNTPTVRGLMRFKIIPYVGSNDIREIFNDMRAGIGTSGTVANVRPLFPGQTAGSEHNIVPTFDNADHVLDETSLLLVSLRYRSTEMAESEEDHFFTERCYLLDCDKDLRASDGILVSAQYTLTDAETIRTFGDW